MAQLKSRVNAIAAGDKTYQGKPCKHGHPGERYIASGNCIECNALHSAEMKATGYWKDRERKTLDALFAHKSADELRAVLHAFEGAVQGEQTHLISPKGAELVNDLLTLVAKKTARAERRRVR